MKLTLFFVTSLALGALAAPHWDHDHDHRDPWRPQCKAPVKTVTKTRTVAKNTVTKTTTRTRVETKAVCKVTRTKYFTVKQKTTVTKVATQTVNTTLKPETVTVVSTATVDPVTVVTTVQTTLDPVTVYETSTAAPETVYVTTVSALPAETVTSTAIETASSTTTTEPEPTTTTEPEPTTTTEPEPTTTNTTTTTEPEPTTTTPANPNCTPVAGAPLLVNSGFEERTSEPAWKYTHISGRTTQNGISISSSRYSNTGIGFYRAAGDSQQAHSFSLSTTVANFDCAKAYDFSIWTWGAIASTNRCTAEIWVAGERKSEPVAIQTGYRYDGAGTVIGDDYGKTGPVRFEVENNAVEVAVRVSCLKGTVVFLDDALIEQVN